MNQQSALSSVDYQDVCRKCKSEGGLYNMYVKFT